MLLGSIDSRFCVWLCSFAMVAWTSSRVNFSTRRMDIACGSSFSECDTNSPKARNFGYVVIAVIVVFVVVADADVAGAAAEWPSGRRLAAGGSSSCACGARFGLATRSSSSGCRQFAIGSAAFPLSMLLLLLLLLMLLLLLLLMLLLLALIALLTFVGVLCGMLQ